MTLMSLNITTPPRDKEMHDLINKIKNEPLSWRDRVINVSRLYDILFNGNKESTVAKVAPLLQTSSREVLKILTINKKLSSPLLQKATSINSAHSMLSNKISNTTNVIADTISSIGTDLFSEITTAAPIEKPEPSVICTDFKTWLDSHAGPKFNLIHCAFPFSTKESYNDFLSLFCLSLDKFCSNSAHVLFWFPFQYYNVTRQKLGTAGLAVQRHPLIWFHSDNAGVSPKQKDQFPKQVYETALLCSTGHRPLVKQLSNLYACPVGTGENFRNQKPEPMLFHFLSMLVDKTTDVFDPLCGNGASLRAANRLGARSVLGLEPNPDQAVKTHFSIAQAQKMRGL